MTNYPTFFDIGSVSHLIFRVTIRFWVPITLLAAERDSNVSTEGREGRVRKEVTGKRKRPGMWSRRV